MKKILYLFMFILLFVACEQTLENENFNVPETNIVDKWTVNAYIDNNLIFGPFTISTQMMPDNQSIYIKDNSEFWNFQTKAKIGDLNGEFETQSSENEISSVNAKIKIINGSLVNKDSIAFDIQFEDDETPYGFTYKIAGLRK